MLFAIILMMILYISILMWGQVVMTGVIEEKSSRVVEVMASGVPSTQLLAGKLLGIGAAGFTQLLVWAAVARRALAGAGRRLAPGAFPMPELHAARARLVRALLPARLPALRGALRGDRRRVNTVQEAQNFVVPGVLPLIVGLVCFPVVLESPDSPLAVGAVADPAALAAADVPAHRRADAAALADRALDRPARALTIAGRALVSARIYRVGILMYGKKPTFPELMRWVRHS